MLLFCLAFLPRSPLSFCFFDLLLTLLASLCCLMTLALPADPAVDKSDSTGKEGDGKGTRLVTQDLLSPLQESVGGTCCFFSLLFSPPPL